MSDSVNSTASSSFEDNVTTGRRVFNYALASLQWGLTIAAAWSCSSIVLGIIVFIITALVMELLTMLISMFIITPGMVNTVGSVVNRTAGRVAGVFTRYSNKAAA